MEYYKIKPNPYLKNLICLYVEDEEQIRESFTLMIKRYFKEVITAKNGQEGFEKFKKHSPDIVISDIRMPVMDGIKMVTEIKSLKPDSFVIFITAFSDLEYLKAAIELGVEGYITKPIDKHKLLQKLNSLATIIKQKRDIEEFLKLLQEVFDKQPNPTLLIENGEIKLINKAFKLLFPDIDSLDKMLDVLKIDFNKHQQEISFCLNEKPITFKVTIQQLNNSLLITFDDISNLEKEILTDQLTKLYNRKIIDKILETDLFEKKCAILFDIDNFKNINDTYGHPVGDIVLKEISDIIRRSVRKKDIIVRWGGEEFLILLSDIESIEIAKKIAEFIRERIEKYNFTKVGHVTCSFGVFCQKINNKNDFEELIKKADTALYKAKEKGKNRVEVYEN
jgi:diguanylate cyclase (GGDEF)-like protein